MPLRYLITLSVCGLGADIALGQKIDYSRDIKPILANSCWTCHGPDDSQRKADLRLDRREDAVRSAIIAGQADQSELIARITSTDKQTVMPPPRAKKPSITPAQVALLKTWINEGATFEEHWAYKKPSRPALPEITNRAWVRTPIDRFIAAEHERRGFSPAPEADRVTLLRRLSFDLLGLPPTPAEIDAFVNDPSPNAYEKQVERILNSKHFGERMAVFWLDLVRYADTGGYHSDNHRDVALYRDYVIEAFNRNLPFDQFTLEQLAGDLLPEATATHRIASGYNRLLMTTEEGGAQAKEYIAKYAADRVRNASGVWLGATLGCAECHNHKYDPYTTKDFYRFAAFFADIQERAVGRQEQTLLPTDEQAAALAQLDKALKVLKDELAKGSAEITKGQAAWETQVATEKFKGLPKPIVDALSVEPAKRNKDQIAAIAKHYIEIVAPEKAAIRKEIAAVTAQREALVKTIPTTLVSMSGPPRMVRILPRGNWLDDSGEVVSPNVPAFLGNVETKPRAGRLELARWLVSPENPLTARVYVNRLWKLVFGYGIVRTPDDFGTQGALPTHPELLDWLAVEFMAGGWNTKEMLRRLVLSNTYRQRSTTTAEVRERDPLNLYLARQNRFRLDAEFLRDNALAVSGLLNRKIGGPSVKPYQPVGYWAFLNFPKRDWIADRGADQYRRGLYTYWCRSFTHPSLLAFDAPTREECTVERPRSSTPLQALVLLNDPTYVEAARVFAERIMRHGGKTTADRLTYALKQTLGRPITAKEAEVLSALHAKHLRDYSATPADAEAVLKVGDAPPPSDLPKAELAAWTSIARVLLNLHETVTRN